MAQSEIDSTAVRDRIREIIADTAEVQTDQVPVHENFYQTLGLDSLRAVMIAVEIQYAFQVRVPREEALMRQLDSVDKLVSFVMARSVGLTT